MAWGPPYLEPDEMADYVHVDDDVDEAEYIRAIEAASRAIDHACNRQFGSVAAESRIFTPRWSFTRAAWMVELDDFTSLSALEFDTAGDGTFATTFDVTKAFLLPANAAKEGRPFERIVIRGAQTIPAVPYYHDSVRATAPWGWTMGVPVTIKEATAVQANRFAARRNAPYGIAGSPETGSELRLLAKADPDVIVMVQPYRRRVLP